MLMLLTRGAVVCPQVFADKWQQVIHPDVRQSRGCHEIRLIFNVRNVTLSASRFRIRNLSPTS